MDSVTTWREEKTIQSSEADFQKQIKLSNVFLQLQDAASTHAERLGVGYDAMLEREMAWVLSRIKVRFDYLPRMGERMIVQTWPKGIQQKIFFMRDFRITGTDGRSFVAATSAYVLVSTRSRRILMPGALDTPVPDNDGLSALSESLDKITPVENPQLCYTLQAGYSAIDIMEHVNNARYIDWICDCYPLEQFQQHRPAWLQVNFQNEVRPGDAISLFRGRRQEAVETGSTIVDAITGVHQKSSSRAFEAEMGWA